jgi:hypothetical protein
MASSLEIGVQRSAEGPTEGGAVLGRAYLRGGSNMYNMGDTFREEGNGGAYGTILGESSSW